MEPTSVVATFTPATAGEVTGVLDVLGSVFEFLIDQISSLVDVVMANPLLLIPIGVVLAYTIIRIFKSLF